MRFLEQDPSFMKFHEMRARKGYREYAWNTKVLQDWLIFVKTPTQPQLNST